MAFPTSGLTNNLIHKEGNRAFVYDSTLGVWDQVRETTPPILGEINDGIIAGGVTFPDGHVVQSQHWTNSNLSGVDGAYYSPGRAGRTFNNPMASASHNVIIIMNLTLIQNDTIGDSHVNIYIGGGGLGATSSGHTGASGMLYKISTGAHREYMSTATIDTTNASGTSPHYYIYISPEGGSSTEVVDINMTMIEVVA